MSKVDFNGDGLSDILWRNDAGLLTDWLATGKNRSFVPNDNANSAVSPAWDVVGIGDFNGDGRSDILWRHEAGPVSSWLSTGGGAWGAGSGSEVPLVWAVEGTGDFNGDGRDDILWRNSDSGQLAEWLSQADGSWVINAANVSSVVTSNWHVVGTGDFNGDGRDDILWRSSDGLVADWLGTASGGFTQGSGTTAPIGSIAKGIGDFNGDGRDDILWTFPGNGHAEIWLTESDAGWRGQSINLGSVSGWEVVGVGQYGATSVNDPGRDDILWRNADGQLITWLMHGPGEANPFEPGLTASVSSDWHVEIYNPSPWDY